MQEYVALRIGRELMRENGLTGWTIKLDKGTKRQGVCQHWERSLGLSRTFVNLNDEQRIRLTILHEIAHAIVGPLHQHDYVWRAKCIEIGGDGEQYATDMKAKAWVGRCMNPACGKAVGQFYRKPTKNYVHSGCYPSYAVKWNREIVEIP